MPPEERGIGMVFQDCALFPHLTVARNVTFGLRKIPASEARRRAERMLDLVGLTHAANAWPHELSGGQQQRVALARALAPQPSLMLLDEPFSNLDVELRERLSLEVRDILKASNTTAILVTHDQHEAFALADEIGIMSDGALEQWASAYDLYHRPGTRFVADFVGQGVFLRGECEIVEDEETTLATLGKIGARAAGSDVPPPREAMEGMRGQARKRVTLIFRPSKTRTWDHAKLGGAY